MATGGLRGIRTARLLLRPFAGEDVDAWHIAIFSDPEVMRWLPSRVPVPRQRVVDLLRSFTEHWDQHGFGVWAVTLWGEHALRGRLIGHCGLRYLPELPGVELLYGISRAHWRAGVATEAARASVRHGFEEAGLDRIVALAMPDNVASRRVMEKVGMSYEKPAFLFGLDLVQYTLSRDDYQTDPSPYALTEPTAPEG